jgi:hypothetical protein
LTVSLSSITGLSSHPIVAPRSRPELIIVVDSCFVVAGGHPGAPDQPPSTDPPQ